MKEPTIKDAEYILKLVSELEPFNIKTQGKGCSSTVYRFNFNRDEDWALSCNYIPINKGILDKTKLLSDEPEEILNGIKMLLSFNGDTMISVIELWPGREIQDAEHILELVSDLEPFNIKTQGKDCSTTVYEFYFDEDKEDWTLTLNYSNIPIDEGILNKAKVTILLADNTKEVLEGIKMLLSFNGDTMISAIELGITK